jgi:hypothetical protein
VSEINFWRQYVPGFGYLLSKRLIIPFKMFGLILPVIAFICQYFPVPGKEEQKDCVLWVKAQPDHEPLFSILDGLRLDAERRYWIEGLEAQEDNCDIEADTGQVSTGVEILLQMSHNTRVKR